MNNIGDGKKRIYDLEDRANQFAMDCIAYVNSLPKTIPNIEISRQLVRSCGSVGANYIEANESLGRKDFVMHARISKKEAKESRHWLRLSAPHDCNLQKRDSLINESEELVKILEVISKIANFR